ncbi:hypothetical protein [Paenibacillus silviterrae]|nr:hypothetical protein [Paenibacillus chinjuensis]
MRRLRIRSVRGSMVSGMRFAEPHTGQSASGVSASASAKYGTPAEAN